MTAGRRRTRAGGDPVGRAARPALHRHVHVHLLDAPPRRPAQPLPPRSRSSPPHRRPPPPPHPFPPQFLTDHIGSVRDSLLILCLWLLWTVLFWAIAFCLAARAAAKEEQEESD